jgi:hypothetical protein
VVLCSLLNKVTKKNLELLIPPNFLSVVQLLSSSGTRLTGSSEVMLIQRMKQKSGKTD